MKKLLSGLLLASTLIGLISPSQAALTFQATPLRQNSGMVSLYSSYITATGSDATSPITGARIINNLDASIQSIHAMANVTSAGGTSPTMTLVLQGSLDGTNFFNITSKQASTAGTLASMQTAANSMPGVFGIASASYDRLGHFPPYLRVLVSLGGTSPTWNGTVQVFINRNK